MADRPGFLFCVCPDAELIRGHIRGLLEKRSENWRIKTFWADEELPDSFWEALSLTGILGDSAAVILRRAERLQAASWRKLSPVLCRFKPNIWPFFCIESQWSKGDPPVPAVLKKQKFFQLAEQKRWIWKSSGFSRQSLKGHLQRWAESQGRLFSGQSLALATEILPLDGAGLKNELQKIELLLGDRQQIQPEDLSVVSFQADMDSFAFLQALQSKGQKIALWKKLIRNQLDSGQDMVLPFLGLMLWESRQLWQLAAGDSGKVRLPARIKDTKTRMARKLGQRKLAEIWTHVLEAEIGIKSGQFTAAQAMEILISKLMLLFET
ncbi:MAG: DNA polymerase III subunit delta [Thermodesulfobacteriota bacterium]